MRQPRSLPMSLIIPPLTIPASRNTHLFLENKEKNSIITTNSVIVSQKVSTDMEQKTNEPSV